MRKAARKQARGTLERDLVSRLGQRSLVLVGLMGSGKTSVGRRLAKRLELPFVDADDEIEKAAGGQAIKDIFREHGEAYFREGEHRVIARLLREGPCVVATGGGAYMDPRTRAAISESGIAIWLKADLPVLVERVMRRPAEDRPMLQRDGRSPEENMSLLMAQRNPVYALADITVETRDVSHEVVVDDIVEALLASGGLASEGAP